MLAKLFLIIKYGVLIFVVLSVAITLITLIFNDFKPKAEYLGKPRPPIDYSIETKIDKVLKPYLAEHPGMSGLYLLDDGLEAFADRILLVRNAERTIDLQYYIWHSDLTGNILGYELLKAADRGVFVRILLDDLNAVDKDYVLSGLAEHPNVEIRLFNPVFSRKNFITRTVEMVFRGLSLNRRMHNKMLISDGRIAIIGGRNIGNEYFDANDTTNFFDVDLLLVGPIIEKGEAIFEEFWSSQVSIPILQISSSQGESLETLKSRSLTYMESEKDILEAYTEAIKHYFDVDNILSKQEFFVWTDRVGIYSDPPEKVLDQREDEWLINGALQQIWTSARSSVDLISPYFVPGDAGTEYIEQLAKNQIKVRILTNSLAANDVPMVHAGYAPYRERLIKSGVLLYELKPFDLKYKAFKFNKIGASGASLHTKALLIDRESGFIGSFNHDPRSARINTEMGVFFTSPRIVEHLETRYKQILDEDSYLVTLKEGDLEWIDPSPKPGEEKVWDHEPETSLFKRGLVKVLSWLPIESQL